MELPQIKTSCRRIDNMLYQGYVPRVVRTSLEVGLFDALTEGAMDAKKLSDKTGTVENLTEVFADILVSLNLLEKEGSNYSLTLEAAELLVKSSPAYQGGFIAMTAVYDEFMRNMPELLKNGPVMPDQNMWSSAETLRIMGQATMAGSIQEVTEFVTALPEFPNLNHMCDLAGNHGFYTMSLLDRNPRLKATLCDLPPVAKLAGDLVAEMGYSDRLDIIGANLETNDPIGEGYDLVFASHIIYGWKGRLEDIFDKINRIMIPGGVFVSNHMALDDGNGASVVCLMRELLTRMMGYPSHHLAENELKQALSSCGFGDFTIRPAREGMQYPTLILAARKQG